MAEPLRLLGIEKGLSLILRGQRPTNYSVRQTRDATLVREYAANMPLKLPHARYDLTIDDQADRGLPGREAFFSDFEAAIKNAKEIGTEQ